MSILYCLLNRYKCPISINGNVIEGNEWNVNVPRKSFPTYQAIIIIDWDWCHLSLLAVYIILYPLSSACPAVHSCRPPGAGCCVQSVQCAVCVAARPGPSTRTLQQWLTPIPSFTANCNYCHPVTFPSLQACYWGSTLRSSLPILPAPALFLESLNYWLENLKLCQVVSGDGGTEAVATQRWLRLWPRLNLTSFVFTLFCECYEDYFITASLLWWPQSQLARQLGKSWSWCGCQLFCIKIQSI